VGGRHVSWYPHVRASARGGEWRPSIIVHPPRDCEREGCREGGGWVVAKRRGTPMRERARGVASGDRASLYTPHAIASARGVGRG
jgi:hypothetical protein